MPKIIPPGTICNKVIFSPVFASSNRGVGHTPIIEIKCHHLYMFVYCKFVKNDFAIAKQYLPKPTKEKRSVG